jgi:hypothetical protein
MDELFKYADPVGSRIYHINAHQKIGLYGLLNFSVGSG